MRPSPATLKGRLFLGNAFDAYTIARHFSEGWRFRITRKAPEDKEQVTPQPGNARTNTVLAGIINKYGKLTLAGGSGTTLPKAEEGDYLIIFSKREEEDNSQS